MLVYFDTDELVDLIKREEVDEEGNGTRRKGEGERADEIDQQEGGRLERWMQAEPEMEMQMGERESGRERRGEVK